MSVNEAHESAMHSLLHALRDDSRGGRKGGLALGPIGYVSSLACDADRTSCALRCVVRTPNYVECWTMR